ncbi:hypothetical protein BFJ63_vAg10261 [Fusarium oxysporum f. sp. narcissi]|jgi:hypothetical protein|uniref:Uncharacterized protein n=3 Tax=Fusarium oxysporum TaxID=5507 RepID=A0A420P9E5_FUSOX|nr:hypothetical protein BFJ65_g7064 [Fusarium oxysporum f. sp. cepae]RKK89129.1 hypothetical protein BFJ71_g12508 [Fusarium oxysporum]RYC86867.1 hypothetical protein BFJ63_vAg10261 [Fusarium oxysporum f. sp. narcissi]RKK34011.1 hypothetical protein BFJ67_g13993 [Fusarium oxysporum f. sp. cepae]RKK51276.1 hypothetical protein BFJ66_g6186 [Fusarium oxysporum f. sp. cepae]
MLEHTVVVLSLSASRPLKVGALDSQVAIEAGAPGFTKYLGERYPCDGDAAAVLSS